MHSSKVIGFYTADSNSRTGFDSDRICECLVVSINYTNGNTYLLPQQNIYYTGKIFITWTKYLLPGQNFTHRIIIHGPNYIYYLDKIFITWANSYDITRYALDVSFYVTEKHFNITRTLTTVCATNRHFLLTR